LLCGVIEYGNNQKYLLDFDDYNKFIGFNKKFGFITDKDEYPSYCHNYKRFTLLEFIYTIKHDDKVCYIFKNKNRFDLRKTNVDVQHVYQPVVGKQYNILEYIPGHFYTHGKEANVMKNPLWRIKEDENEYLLMHCETNTICKLCPISYQKILDFEKNRCNSKKITFYKHSNGYISCHRDNLYIHQIITGCYGNGKGTKTISVDHIDHDPLNNTYYNLRVATRETQEQNSKGIIPGTKRARKTSAQDLPDGITENMLSKYVTYNKECYNKKNNSFREFFRVEKHPKLPKGACSTKSIKVSILDKLAEANKIVADLENDIYPNKKESDLPKYVRQINVRDKTHLIYDRKLQDGSRQNTKMVLPEEYSLEEQLTIFDKKIFAKYDYHIETSN